MISSIYRIMHSILSCPSNNSLTIYLFDNRLNGSSFTVNTFLTNQRPTRLSLDIGNKAHITYLDEKVFLPFLMANSQNTINLRHHNIDCEDCRNYWLIENPGLLSNINNLLCSDNHEFTNNSNFKTCY